MGKIISSKRSRRGKVILEVEVDYSEMNNLNGFYDDIYLFARENFTFKSSISSRGKNSATKYFLIPKVMRRGVDVFSGMCCQCINLGNKMAFVYLVDRKKSFEDRRRIRKFSRSNISKEMNKVEIEA